MRSPRYGGACCDCGARLPEFNNQARYCEKCRHERRVGNGAASNLKRGRGPYVPVPQIDRTDEQLARRAMARAAIRLQAVDHLPEIAAMLGGPG